MIEKLCVWEAYIYYNLTDPALAHLNPDPGLPIKWEKVQDPDQDHPKVESRLEQDLGPVQETQHPDQDRDRSYQGQGHNQCYQEDHKSRDQGLVRDHVLFLDLFQDPDHALYQDPVQDQNRTQFQNHDPGQDPGQFEVTDQELLVLQDQEVDLDLVVVSILSETFHPIVINLNLTNSTKNFHLNVITHEL